MNTKELQETKKDYQSPVLKIVEFKVEEGFASSGAQLNSIWSDEDTKMPTDNSSFETFSFQDVQTMFH